MQGDVRSVLAMLPEESVDCCVTSPPYYGLRAYNTSPQTWEDGWKGELGAEKHPDEFVAHLVEVFRAVKRVLRSDGCAFVNLGDSYTGGASVGFRPGAGRADGKVDSRGQRNRNGIGSVEGLKSKDLCLIPYRFALAAQRDGWYVRSVFPWLKQNGLPSSVTDRFGCNHETFLLLTKSETYFWDRFAVLLPYAESTLLQVNKAYNGQAQKDYDGALAQNPSDTKRRIVASLSFQREGSKRGESHVGKQGTHRPDRDEGEPNPVGRNRRTSDTFLESLDTVILEQEQWLAHLKHVKANGGLLVDPEGDPLALCVNTQPFTAKKYGIKDHEHYACYPADLVKPLILASTPQVGCCANCGASYNRVVEQGDAFKVSGNQGTTRKLHAGDVPQSASSTMQTGSLTTQNTVGWTKGCSCETDEREPATVCDPFSGSGSTGEAALLLGRDYLGVELHPDSCRLSEARLNHVVGNTGLFADPVEEEVREAKMRMESLFGEEEV